MLDKFQAFVEAGTAVDLILIILLLEAVVLVFALRAGWARVLTILAALLPGACLLMALRSALSGDGWVAISLWLALSFPLHLVDIARRPP